MALRDAVEHYPRSGFAGCDCLNPRSKWDLDEGFLQGYFGYYAVETKPLVSLSSMGKLPCALRDLEFFVCGNDEGGDARISRADAGLAAAIGRFVERQS